MNNFIIGITLFTSYTVVAAIVTALLKKYKPYNINRMDATAMGIIFPVSLLLMVLRTIFVFVENVVGKLLEKLK